MLYCTTINDSVTYNAHIPLEQSYANVGQIFVPQKFPLFSSRDIMDLQKKTFGQNIAEILNLFFDTELSGWDVDFCIGRSTMRIAQINNKLFTVELWHTPTDSFNYLISRLFNTVNKSATGKQPSEWFQICIRIACLFAAFGSLFQSCTPSNNATVDLSLSGNDLAMPLAAFYAKRMGLPIGSLIITSDSNKCLWDLVHRGDVYLSERSESLSIGVERLIHGVLGRDAAARFRTTYNQGKVFRLEEEDLPVMNSGIFCAITGSERTQQTINSVYRTNQYILDPVTAMCIGGLNDYRARRGEHKLTVTFAEQSPKLHLECIEAATGLTKCKLSELFNIL